jgi:hypothetical protein
MSQSGGGSTTRHVIEVMYQVTGLDKAGAGITSLNKSVTQGQTTLDKFGTSATKASTETNKLATSAKSVAPSIDKTASSAEKLDKSQTKAGNSAKGLAEKFRGNKGLIFSTTMLSSGVFEAIGMFQGWTDASEKLGQAQAKLADLEERGMENTKEYGQAVKEVSDAQRGYNFITRFTIQSFADLLPMSLMMISSITDLTGKFMEGASMKEKFAAASTKVTGGLKSIGSAMMSFTMSHPILLLFTAISAIVIALITDFGGFRTALNNVGVAIGNAIPGLKGFLDWLGQIGNGFSNTVMAMMGFKEKTTEALIDVEEQVLKTGDATKLSIDDQIVLFHKLGEEGESVYFSLSTHLKMQQDEQKEHTQKFEEFVTAIESGDQEIMDSLGLTAEEYTAFYKEWQEKIASFEDAFSAHVDQVVQNYQTFADEARKSQESQSEELTKLHQKLMEHYQKREEIRDKDGESQDKAMEKWKQEKDEILYAIGEIETGLSDMAAAARDDWAEFSATGESAMKTFRMEAVGGNFQEAINIISTAMDDVPEKYQGNMSAARAIIDNEMLSAQTRVNLFVAFMDKLDPFKSFIVSGQEYTRVQAEVTSGLDELAVAARANVSESSAMEAAWTNFVNSLSPAQKALPVVQSNIEGVNKGAIDAASAFANVEAAGVQMSEALGTTVTRSFEDLSKVIIDLPGPMTAVFANIGGQIQKVGEVTDQSLVSGPKSAVGSMKKMETENQTLAQSVNKELGTNATQYLKTFSTKAGTESTAVITKLQGLGGEMKKTSTTTKTETGSWTKALSDFASSAQKSINSVIGYLGDLGKKIQEGAGGLWDQLTKLLGGGGLSEAFASGGGGEGMNFMPFLDTTLYEQKLAELKTMTSQTTTEVSQMYVTMETSIRTTFSRITALFPTAFTTLPTLAQQATAQASAAFVTMEASIKGTITRIAAVFPTAFTQLYTFAAQSTGQTIQAFVVMQTQIQGIMSKITMLFQPAFANLAPVVTQATSQASVPFTTMESSIRGTLSRITIMFNPAFASLPPIATQNTTNASAAFMTMQSSIQATLNRIKALFPSAFTPLVSAAQTSTQQAANHFARLSQTFQGLMNNMASSATKFANSFKSAMSATEQSAKRAQNAVSALQKAINNLKGKSVYIGLTGPGARFMRHGGAFISPEPTGFAASGMSFINSKPRKIGGVNISEFGKPELVTVTPLSDPGNPMDKGMNLGMSIPRRPQPMSSALGANPFSSGGAGSGQQQPIQVTGNVYVTVKTQNGKVLAQEVQPYLLQDFGGVT